MITTFNLMGIALIAFSNEIEAFHLDQRMGKIARLDRDHFNRTVLLLLVTLLRIGIACLEIMSKEMLFRLNIESRVDWFLRYLDYISVNNFNKLLILYDNYVFLFIIVHWEGSNNYCLFNQSSNLDSDYYWF